MYANDHRDRLAYNLGGNAKEKTVAPRNPMNWVNGVMGWELDSDNTNYALIQEASLAPFCQNNVQIYKCPADRALHEIQRQAGWKERTRSYSMNAMVGNAGDLSTTGTNVNNPDYKQFFSFAEIPRPASIFVFMDEHPDSINDGYFLVKREYNPANRYASTTNLWWDLPGSQHGNGAVISFADGHVETHQWTDAATYAPSQPDVVNLPLEIPNDQRTDFYWLLRRSSVVH